MELNVNNLIKWTAFNRRNFIKLLVGGAAGIHLTPLPWKLMDDSAIWTQNWPWVPVPSEGAVSYVKSVCQLCPGGCGIEVRKVAERAVKIEGRTDYPVNPGGLCPLGAGGLQLLYNENVRFTGPMRRVGPRGSGQFLQISWEEALKELAGRIAQLRREGRPEALAAIDGNRCGSTTSLMIQRLLEACGSPNYMRIPSAEDTYALANGLMLGRDIPMAYDLENADFVLSFGCGLIEGWGAPGRMIHAWGLWNDEPGKKRVRVVQVEPRASNTASKADKWIAPWPGTEGALALGLAHVIIREGLFDTTFVADHTFGFTDGTSKEGKEQRGFKTLVLQKYSPEAVSRVTGVDAGEIVSLAKAFAKAKTPVAVCGKGKGYLNGSLLEFMCVQALNALVGNLNRPGGVLVADPLSLSPLPEPVKDAVAAEGLKKPRLDQAGTKAFPFASSLIHNFAEAVLKSRKSPVDILLVFSANPVHNLPVGGAFDYAAQKIPYIVSFSPYRDDTAVMADLVLPDHTYLEKKEEVLWPVGLQYPLFGLSRPVVKPLYDTRQSGDVLIGLAKGIAPSVSASFPWKSFEEALKQRAKGLFEAGGGLTTYDGKTPVWKGFNDPKRTASEFKSFDEMWKKLESGGFWYKASQEFRRGEGLFKTPSGKFEFYSSNAERAVAGLAAGGSLKTAMGKMGLTVDPDEACLPHYEPASSGVDKEKYPLLLLPYELINLSSGWLPNPHFLNKTLFDTQVYKDDAFADVNPKTASQYGLKQGDAVYVESRKGRVSVRLNLAEGVMPGVLFLPMGLGHKAYDEYQRGKGVNVCEIMEPGKDPLSGQPAWWETRVRVYKA